MRGTTIKLLLYRVLYCRATLYLRETTFQLIQLMSGSPYKLLILVTLSLMLHSLLAQQYSYVSCVPYDPDTNICYDPAVDGQTISKKIATCPSDSYCDYARVTNLTKVYCKKLKENGQACDSYVECKSRFCVSKQCRDRLGKLGDSVLSDLECGKGLYMDLTTGKCRRQSTAGYACADTSVYYACKGRLICNDGFCWQPMTLPNGAAAKNNQACKSLYINSTTSLCSTAPKLIGASAVGKKPCVPATVDTDCQYLVDSTVFTAKQLKKSCVSTEYATSVKSYCELGEGDEVYIQASKRFISFMESDVRNEEKMMRAQMLGNPANYIKNYDAASCTLYSYTSLASGLLDSTVQIAMLIIVAIITLLLQSQTESETQQYLTNASFIELFYTHILSLVSNRIRE